MTYEWIKPQSGVFVPDSPASCYCPAEVPDSMVREITRNRAITWSGVALCDRQAGHTGRHLILEYIPYETHRKRASTGMLPVLAVWGHR